MENHKQVWVLPKSMALRKCDKYPFLLASPTVDRQQQYLSIPCQNSSDIHLAMVISMSCIIYKQNNHSNKMPKGKATKTEILNIIGIRLRLRWAFTRINDANARI